MDETHRALLKQYWLELFQDLEPSVLLPRLVDILIDGDDELVRTQNTRIEQVDVLLKLIQRRGPKAFNCLLGALKEVQPHLAALLQKEEEVITERVSSANLRGKLSETETELRREKIKNSSLLKDYTDLKRIHEEQLKKLQEQILSTEENLKTYFQEVLENKIKDVSTILVQDENENTITKSLIEMNKTLANSQQREKELELKCGQLQIKLDSLKSKKPLEDKSTSPIPLKCTELTPCERCKIEEHKYFTLLEEERRRNNEEMQKLNACKIKYGEQLKKLEKDLSSQLLIEKAHAHNVEEAKKRLSDKDGELKNVMKENKALKKEKKSYEKQLNKMSMESEKHRSEKEELLEDLKNLNEFQERSQQEIDFLMKKAHNAQIEYDRVNCQLEQWKYLPGRVLNFNKAFDHNGIIYTLRKENISILATRSSGYSYGEPKDILEHSTGKHSCTDNKEGSWWQIDLGENVLVFPNHYALRHGSSDGHGVIINWRLLWSRDGRKWKVLREHKNERQWFRQSSDSPYFTGSWSLHGQVDAVRYLRIYQTGKNSSGNYTLYLSGIEIYGVLLSV